MIDTVILSMPKDELQILMNKDGSSPWSLQSTSAGFKKFVLNPTARDRQLGIYKPRITGTVRTESGMGTIMNVRLEFSVPKMLYDNNLDEIEDVDFPKMLTILRERMYDMGIIATEDQLAHAEVVAFHPSKNILLADGYTAAFVIGELRKIDLAGRFDLDKVSFRNNGESLQMYTATHSLVFYDKIADMGKPKKRAIDKDQTAQQVSLFVEIRKQELSHQVLRIEVRLSKKRKMHAVLKKLGLPEHPTFREVVSKDICGPILMDYWHTMVANRNFALFDLRSEPLVILQQITKEAPTIGAKEAIYRTGLLLLAKDNEGVRGLRKALTGKTGARNWRRLVRPLLDTGRSRKITECHSWVRQVEENITQCGAYRCPSELLMVYGSTSIFINK